MEYKYSSSQMQKKIKIILGNLETASEIKGRRLSWEGEEMLLRVVKREGLRINASFYALLIP